MKVVVFARRLDKDCYRIMRDGEVVGEALRLTTGRWGLFDCEGRRLSGQTFEKPNEVAAAFGRPVGDRNRETAA